jgi:hypothetical protein
MAINQLSTANTFQQWLIATQSLIEKSNFFEGTANIVFETANNVSNTANLVFANAAVINAQTTLVLTTADNVYATADNVYSTYANTIIVAGFVNSNLTIALNTANSITSNALNTSISITSDALNTSNSITNDALNVSNIIVNSANSFANTVNVTAQAAFNTANSALLIAQDAANVVYEITDDTSNNTTLFVALFDANTGTPNTAYVSSSKLFYNPSTGELSATNFDSLSDVNKKTDIETIQNAIETVCELRGVTFRWKDNGHKSMGLIAQEVESVVPEVVVTNELGDKSVTYGSLIGLLVEAIKELNDKIYTVENNINIK